jgi:threonine/homoserine/homoserine lactone efflux protein
MALAVLPGPATALFLHRTLRDGRRAGLAAVTGNEIGLFCWVIAGGAGLSVLLEANRLLFDSLHVAGAAVLVYLGLQAWRASPAAGSDPPAPEMRVGRGPGAAFRASLVSIAANPKAAVFAVSFFPQFLPRTGPALPVILALATIQVLIDTLWCVGIVLLADRARAWLGRGRIRQRIERILGAVLVGLGFELGVQAR